jgi:OOP family OmpA-OmpF porin
MMKKQLIAVALVGVSFMSAAQAKEFLDDRWYVAPFGTYVMPDSNRHVTDGWGAGLGVGKILNEHFNVELRGFYQEYSAFDGLNPVRNGGDWRMAGGTADLQYHFMRQALQDYKVSPYAVVSAGGINNWVPGDDGVSFITEAGIGATYELIDNLLLRADVRYRYANDFGAHLRSPASSADDHHDMVVNAGVVIPFGEKPKAAVKEEPKPVEKAVDCSTLDDDNDGVNNCLDKCPGSLSGSKVDASGCPISIELKGVQFKVNSAVLTEKAKAILDDVAKDLIASSQGKDIEVQGHTSSEASDAYNMKLSQRRSQAVVKYLKAQGVKDKLYAKGYGETQLKVQDGKDESLRAINRRVELHWME